MRVPPTCWLLAALIAAVVPVVPGLPVMAAEGVSETERRQVFAAAERVEPFTGSPPVAAAVAKGQTIGWIFSTAAIVGSTGYSGQPLDVLVGLGRDGVIQGALLRRHAEPILVIGIDDADLAAYVGRFTGLEVGVRGRITPGQRPGPDALAGATVTSAVIGDAIMRSARIVAAAHGVSGQPGPVVRLDRGDDAPASWAALLADGSLADRRFTNADVAAHAGRPLPGEPDPDGLFLDLAVALLTPPRIGESLLGKHAYGRLMGNLAIDDQPLLITADGRYSVKGVDFVRSGRFERLQVVQGPQTIPLTTAGYENIERLAADGAPEPREAGVFVLPAGSGFDPAQPWRLEILVPAEKTGGAPVVLAVDYRLPDHYLRRLPAGALPSLVADPADVPVWRQAWHDRRGAALAVSGLVAVLTVLLVFQDRAVASRRAYRRIRLTFLAVTLLWLGWMAGGQLSVVNVFTFSQALLAGFRWEFFLLDPVIFLLWSWVVVALLFWGRGVYCGWLCPFGALQELASEIARRLRVPQLRVPFAVHERLWPIKYVIFIGLFAVSLHSVKDAFVLAEVEPFKTAITLRFLRDWPFVAYAVALLVAGLFIERFFCRYLCPLGAALAIPARLRMFEWLKRHPQCGRECAICFRHCPVQAIHPEGNINPNECIHCLNCQQLYLDDSICPPLVAARKRRERRAQLSAGAAVRLDRSPGDE